jgi:DNA-binding XRE family transcriptional regulator
VNTIIHNGREKLKQAREECGLTQEQMAKSLGYKSRSHYCMVENGQRGVSVETALAISTILKRPIAELFDAAEVHILQEKDTG